VAAIVAVAGFVVLAILVVTGHVSATEWARRRASTWDLASQIRVPRHLAPIVQRSAFRPIQLDSGPLLLIGAGNPTEVAQVERAILGFAKALPEELSRCLWPATVSRATHAPTSVAALIEAKQGTRLVPGRVVAGQCVGACTTTPIGEGRGVDLTFALRPTHHGRGLGRILLQTAAQLASSNGTEQILARVAQTNWRSSKALVAAGFRPIDRPPASSREPVAPRTKARGPLRRWFDFSELDPFQGLDDSDVNPNQPSLVPEFTTYALSMPHWKWQLPTLPPRQVFLELIRPE
jgi:ribosomal protein S18 acetylase RimI-like enzyme